jgi:hypothetical protein
MPAQLKAFYVQSECEWMQTAAAPGFCCEPGTAYCAEYYNSSERRREFSLFACLPLSCQTPRRPQFPSQCAAVPAKIDAVSDGSGLAGQPAIQKLPTMK